MTHVVCAVEHVKSDFRDRNHRRYSCVWLLPALMIAATTFTSVPALGREAAASHSEPDVCASEASHQTAMLDLIQRRLYRSVCVSARWFDGLFGNRHEFGAVEQPSGALRLGIENTQRDGFDPIVRLRLSLPMPNIDRRVRSFVGRVDSRDYVRDQETGRATTPFDSFGNQPPEWLLGLGFKRQSSRRHQIDYSAGVRVRTPLNPYLKASYQYMVAPSTSQFWRFRQTGFWEREDGFGTTSNLETKRSFGDRRLLTWRTTATVSEATDGTEWWSGITVFQALGKRSAAALVAFAEGETSAPVSTREYGWRLTYRRPIHRDFVYLELGPQLTWIRERPEDVRQANAGLFVALEMQFGDYEY